MKKLIGLLVVFAVAATMAYAVDNTATDDGQAKAKIIQAATITHVSSRFLDFGTLLQPGSNGTVTLTAADTPAASYSGVNHTDAAVSSDKFSLTNLDSATTYAISVPATFTIDGASTTMTVTPSLSDSSVTGVTSKDIYVGGQLAVSANQAAGDYSGSYTVTVTY